MSDTLKTLHQDFKLTLEEKYRVIAYFDLFDYNHNVDKLKHDLLSVKKNKFDSNDLIVFNHFDTDYYIDKNVSVFLYNFVAIISEIDLPSFFVGIATNHYGLKKELDYLCNLHFVENQFKIFYTPCFKLSWDNQKIKDLNINTDLVEFKFSSLTSMHRSHRKILSGFLKENVDYKNSLFSFNFPTALPVFTNNTKHSIKKSISTRVFLELSEKTGINDRFFINDEYRKYFNNYIEFKHHLIDTPANSNQTRYQYELLQKSFLDIVAETVFNYPYPYVTEKTFRPITNKRPFIIFGAPNTLTFLKKLGFETFSMWINEEYDLVECPNQRLQLLFDEILRIEAMPIDALKSTLISMECILEHNFQTYLQLNQKLITECN